MTYIGVFVFLLKIFSRKNFTRNSQGRLGRILSQLICGVGSCLGRGTAAMEEKLPESSFLSLIQNKSLRALMEEEQGKSVPGGQTGIQVGLTPQGKRS